MPRKIAASTLNASTLDILNVIRANASYEYQQNVPKVTKATDIPKVGEIIYGTPAFANQFLNALVNRIAIVRVQDATFNDPYANLKKGYLEFGETIENIFVNIAKVVDYTPEKGEEREFKRTLPDVRTQFHVMNWRVMYPVTIQDEDLKQAFLSLDGVTELITKIVDSVYTAAEYDEFLLFKYMLIKAVSHGQMHPESIGDGTELKPAGVAFRAMSNRLTFMSSEYNEEHVKTTTPRDRQVIFMDADFEAQYDVNVLAAAFNMDKADYLGRRYLIDKWDAFDNDRFKIIRENSDGLEEVTADELALMKNVKAVIADEQWFQVYDNNNRFTEKYVASGLYWNYFYHTWKTVSHSGFANAVVFVTDAANIAMPESITAEITGKDTSDAATVLTLQLENDGAALTPDTAQLLQTETLIEDGIAMQKYGAVIIPADKTATDVTLVAELNGVTYTAATAINAASAVGATVTLNKA